MTRRPVLSRLRPTALLVAALVSSVGAVLAAVGLSAQPDARAIRIAEATLERMGGRESWDRTRYIRWRFFDRRTHYWDKWTGNHRIESEDRLILMNVNTRDGRVWDKGEPTTDPAALEEALVQAHRWWVNDMYWLLMPYKLLDPGVTLTHNGEGQLLDGRPCDLLQVTFDQVGYTPENRYLVCVAHDTGLVEQWSYYAEAADAEPRFTLPWAGWRRFGRIMLSTDRGRDFDWQIAVYDELPSSVFESPDTVDLP